MALAIKTLFDKRKLALTRAKFRAWWEGEEFSEAAAAAEIEAAVNEAAANDAGAEAELFDAPEYDLPARLVALAMLWGDGRVRPGDATADGLEPARIGLPAEGVLAVLGPGLHAPVVALANGHAGKIEVFEWREETLEALTHGIAKANLADRVSVTRIDIEAHVFAPGAYDGVFSIDDFAYCSYPPHLAQQLMKCLKPGACAVVETYVGLRADELRTAFASAFAEPQIRPHGDILQFFTDAGLALEADEDLTDEFLAMARASFKSLGERLTQGSPLEPAAARELAWEAEAWHVRLRLLAQRRIERRRFILRRPAQDANANAPAG